jgi:hypothetical protein
MTLTLGADRDAIDRAALEQCMVLIGDESAGRAEQIDAMVAEDGWQYAAEFAAHVLQVRALSLRPWETPPCSEDADDPDGDKAAQALLREMLAAGVSRYHPNPVQALEAKKRSGA